MRLSWGTVSAVGYVAELMSCTEPQLLDTVPDWRRAVLSSRGHPAAPGSVLAPLLLQPGLGRPGPRTERLLRKAGCSWCFLQCHCTPRSKTALLCLALRPARSSAKLRRTVAGRIPGSMDCLREETQGRAACSTPLCLSQGFRCWHSGVTCSAGSRPPLAWHGLEPKPSVWSHHRQAKGGA